MLTIDATILTKLAPHYTGARAERQATNIRLAGPFFPGALARHDISTLLRKAHFLAQVCEESWGFSDMKEEGSGQGVRHRTGRIARFVAQIGNTAGCLLDNLGLGVRALAGSGENTLRIEGQCFFNPPSFRPGTGKETDHGH